MLRSLLQAPLGWPFRAILWVAAVYGSMVFYHQHLAVPARHQYPTEFLAGMYQIGPRAKMSLSQIWQLLAVRGRYTSGRWKLYEFTEARQGEIAHFLVIWTKEGYPLIAFQLPDLEIERISGQVPKEFHLAPSQDVLATLPTLRPRAYLAGYAPSKSQDVLAGVPSGSPAER